MKKLTQIILLFTVMFLLCACSQKEVESVKIERSIDGVAAYLGYTDGEEISSMWNEENEVTGAKSGKLYSFKYGKVAIYEFDPESKEYQYWESQTSDCIEGFVLLYEYDDLEEVPDSEMLEETERVQSIRFEN